MNKVRPLLELIRDALTAVVLCLFVLQFIGAQARVPSGSMEPTIQIGDRLLISRIPTYYKDPQINEIVVFWKHDMSMIKRVIAGPLDEVNLIGGDVYVNGVKRVEDFVKSPHQNYPIAGSDIEFPYIVPEKHYFVMGDNRGYSLDSRYFGAIAQEDLRAIGAYRILPFDTKGKLK